MVEGRREADDEQQWTALALEGLWWTIRLKAVTWTAGMLKTQVNRKIEAPKLKPVVALVMSASRPQALEGYSSSSHGT